MSKTVATGAVINGTSTADAAEKFVRGEKKNQSPQEFAATLLDFAQSNIMRSGLPEDMQHELQGQFEELQLRLESSIDVMEVRELIPILKEFNSTIGDISADYKRCSMHDWIQILNSQVHELSGGSRIKLGRILVTLGLMTPEDRKSFTPRELSVIDSAQPIAEMHIVGVLEQISATLAR
jgi:hypothetical protein